MIRHGYTFIIAPHAAKPQKSLHMPAWLLNGLASVILLAAATTCFHIGNMLFLYKTMEDEVVPTREENLQLHGTNNNLNGLLSEAYGSINELQARLAGERESYATGLASITSKIQVLEKFAVDLKLMAGYRLESKAAKSLGTGGPILDERAFIQAFLAMPEMRFVSAGKLTEKDLFGREEQLSAAMNELSDWLQKKACILGDVPKGLPCRGIITSPFGARRGGGLHVGLDIAAIEGTPIFAPADGVVVRAGSATGYGNVIILDHGNGFTTRYGHMSRIKVKVGDRVDAGDVIASVGHEGWATGNHLHYEVRLNGVPLDPSRYIPKGLPVQLLDGGKSLFDEKEVGSAIEDLDPGIQLEGDQFVPTPLEDDGSSQSPNEKTSSTSKAIAPIQLKPASDELQSGGK